MINARKSPAEIANRDSLRRMIASGHTYQPYGCACGVCGTGPSYHAPVTPTIGDIVNGETVTWVASDGSGFETAR